VLLYGGLATIAFGAIGVMASLRIGRVAAFSIIVSSGTLLAALAVGVAEVTAAALFYLVSATMAVSALFLLVELVERISNTGPKVPRGGDDDDDDSDDDDAEDTNLDDEELPLVGSVYPVSIALLGLAFLACAVLVAGLPPLSGFIAKVSLISSLLGADDSARAASARWAFVALLLLSGLAATISLARVGIRQFWSTGGRSIVRIKGVEAIAVVALLLACVLLTVRGERALRYVKATAAELHAPSAYIEAVLTAKPRPGPTRADVERHAEAEHEQEQEQGRAP